MILFECQLFQSVYLLFLEKSLMMIISSKIASKIAPRASKNTARILNGVTITKGIKKASNARLGELSISHSSNLSKCKTREKK